MLVGSDLPTLPAAFVVDALERLGRHHTQSLVLGRSEDGGYYLIGLTQVHDELFARMPWGTAEVLHRTQEAARALRLTVELLPRWYDVDRAADLERVQHDTEEQDSGASFTRAWLAAAVPAVRTSAEGETR